MQLAKDLEVAQSTINNWEQGKASPTLDKLEKIARRRGESPQDFIAYLYGEANNRSIVWEDLLAGMDQRQLADLIMRISDRVRNLS